LYVQTTFSSDSLDPATFLCMSQSRTWISNVKCRVLLMFSLVLQELKDYWPSDWDIHFTCILRLLNNTCVKHYFKSVHVSNPFWSREYNSAKEICKYPSFLKVGGNYPLDLKIIDEKVRYKGKKTILNKSKVIRTKKR
jgi:hypothetical protein